MKFPTALIALLLSGLLSAQEEEKKEPRIPAMAVNKALQWMQHHDPEKRQAAYQTFQLYGPSVVDVYRATLEKAMRGHEKKIARLLNDQRENPYHGIDLLTEELKTERERIFKLIHTDYKKESSNIRMLTDEVEKLEKLNVRARKIAQKDSSEFDADISQLAMAMAEVQRELLTIDSEELPHDLPASVEAQHAALNESFDGEVYLKTKSQITMVQEEVALLTKTEEANQNAKWASASQKDFATMISEQRSLFGIPPLLMDEQLSAASTGHSEDMARLRFFAHESPVEGKKSPWDRARVAKFKHRAMGENIFMGSSSPEAAYKAWFGSDGHRFIMFGQGANLIGVGPHGRHWTMMTGKK